MHLALEEYLRQRRGLLARVDRRIMLLNAQRPLLEIYAGNSRLSSADRQTAEALNEDTVSAVAEHQNFRTGIQESIRLADILLNLVRRSDQRFPYSQQAQTLFDDVERQQEEIAREERFFDSLVVLNDNNNFINARRAVFSEPATTGSSPGSTPVPDCPDVMVSSSAGGVAASADSPPGAYTSYASGYQASPETLARFFAHGVPIHGDINRRRHTFGDGSCAILQAYIPVLTTSTESDMFCLGAAAIGASAGSVTANPIGFIVGAIAGLVSTRLLRPYDAAWQGYLANFYADQQTDASLGVRYFSGTKRTSDAGTAFTQNGTAQPENFCNFADQPSTAAWSNWRHGGAIEGPPAASNAGLGCCLARDVDRLVQAQAGLNVPTSASSAPSRHALSIATDPQSLLTRSWI